MNDAKAPSAVPRRPPGLDDSAMTEAPRRQEARE
jgi:hypothetical protein